jgi:hypothetical protein
MSVAYFIVPERAVPGLDCFVNGKALAHIGDGVITRICHEASVRPLQEFCSQDPDEIAAFCEDEGIDPPPGGFPPEQWFRAADGLRTVRALLARVSELASAGPAWAAEGVAADLQQYEEVLVGLDRAGVRWHLAVDF